MLDEKLRNKQRCELRPGDARLFVVGRVDAREGFEHPLEPWQRQPLQVGEAQQPFFFLGDRFTGALSVSLRRLADRNRAVAKQCLRIYRFSQSGRYPVQNGRGHFSLELASDEQR